MASHDPIPDRVVCDEIEIATLFDEFPNASMAEIAAIASERNQA